MSKTADDVLEEQTDVFDDLLGYHLRRLSVIVMSDLAETLAPLGLKAADASVLMMIESNAGITQSNIGKALGILRANMAPLIAGLLKRGLIDREPVDGRSQALCLSAAGQSLCRQIKNLTREHEARLFGRLSGSSKTRLISQLKALWRDSHTP